MRKLDPLAVALSLSVAIALGTVAYVVGSILADPHPPAPIPWSDDRGEALERWHTIQRGVRVTPPLPAPHR
jgi:hypothetical protein